jgi:hypothetical protein
VTRVILGVLSTNLVFLGVGYALLSPALRGSPRKRWLCSWGLALLAGVASVGLSLCLIALTGLTVGIPIFAIVACAIAGLGLVVRQRANSLRRQASQAATPVETAPVVALLKGAVWTVALLTVVAAFRTSVWIDDAWTFWLPKGLLVTARGLDAHAFTGAADVARFANPDYPLWWSIVGGLDSRIVGRVDLRVLDAQIALLLLAFVGAIAELLRKHVRATILWPTLLLITAAPEVSLQALGGAADVPLGIYLALIVATGSTWLLESDRLLLWLTLLFGATAVNIKLEAAALLLLCLVLPTLAVSKRLPRARTRPLLAVFAGALVAGVPWIIWRVAHNVPSDTFSPRFLDPARLADRLDRLWPSIDALAHHAVSNRGWLFILPIFCVISVLTAISDRDFVWLIPLLALALGFAFFGFVYWAGKLELSDWLPTSAFRVVDSLVLGAAVGLPLIAERLVYRRTSR